MGIPTVVQEQNSYPGITNKLLSKKSTIVCVAYDGLERFFPKEKISFTGNPVRANLAIDLHPLRAEAAGFFGLEQDKPTLLIIGGSLGALTLNESMHAALAATQEKNLQVLWQCGKSYDAKLQQNSNTF